MKKLLITLLMILCACIVYAQENSSNDLKAENTPEKENVYPVCVPITQTNNGKTSVILKKASWNVLRFGKN